MSGRERDAAARAARLTRIRHRQVDAAEQAHATATATAMQARAVRAQAVADAAAVTLAGTADQFRRAAARRSLAVGRIADADVAIDRADVAVDQARMRLADTRRDADVAEQLQARRDDAVATLDRRAAQVALVNAAIMHGLATAPPTPGDVADPAGHGTVRS